MAVKLPAFLTDPPPEYAFELSEVGLAYARTGKAPQIGFSELEPDVLAVSPIHDNVARPDALTEKIRHVAPLKDPRKPRRAALILPDYSARVSVLDFDAFPSEQEEQLTLVRFRMKKSVPFEVESAALSYFPQPVEKGQKIHVLVALISLEIIGRYESVFRAAGFHPGLVTTSALAALDLVPSKDVIVIAKLTGLTLAVTVLQKGQARLVRCVELPEVTVEEVTAVLYPTMAFVEDELGTRPDSLVLCGLQEMAARHGQQWETELGVKITGLQSRFGAPAAYNAGLLGYLESVH